LNTLDFALNVAPTVNDDFAITITPAQILIVHSLDPVLTDNVAGLVMLVFVTLVFQLFRAYLLHIPERVCQRSVRRIPSLWSLFDAQGRQFKLVRINPRPIGFIGVLLDQDRFEGGLRLHLFKTLAQNLRIDIQSFGKRLNQGIPIDAFRVLAGKYDAVNWTRINQQIAVTIEDDA